MEILETIRTLGVKTVDPIAKCLTIHASDLRCFATAHAIQNGSQGKKASALAAILTDFGKSAKLETRKNLAMVGLL